MASGGLVRAELARAWEQYFGQKGGQGPIVAPDVLGVIVLDDNSKGPYPTYRSVMSGINYGAVVANFAYVGVIIQDPPGTKSVLQIDYIIARPTTADDMVMAILTTADLTLGNLANMQDCAEEKDQAPSNKPTIGNVQNGSQQSVTNFGGSTIPHNATTAQRWDGPWTLGPQGILVIHPSTLNNGVFAFFRGRYYSAP